MSASPKSRTRRAPRLANQPGEVRTTETYSEDDPWRRVPTLARRNKVTVTFENLVALRAEGSVLENETYVSLLETAKATRKQQLFYLGQRLDGGSGDFAGESDAPDPVALKAAMLDKNRKNENIQRPGGSGACSAAAPRRAGPLAGWGRRSRTRAVNDLARRHCRDGRVD